jgi:uncharacterized protein YgiM (DUF1202 family)
MRKSLLALCVLCSASIGGLSLAPALAAPDRASSLSPSSSSAVSSAAAADVSGAAIVQYAMKFLGYPYTATGNSPSTGFSCIGFVSYVYRSLGINLPGDLGSAMAFAPAVSFSNLLPGDVLYFQNTVWTGLSHAAIYIGGGRFINAEWYNRGVAISGFNNDPVDGNYWSAHYLGANRPWTGVATGSGTIPPAAPANPTVGTPTSPLPSPVTAQAPSGPTARVRVSALNVRSGPSLQSSIRTVVLRGTSVIILARRGVWYRVEMQSGAVGWVIGAGIGKGYLLRQEARAQVQSVVAGSGAAPASTRSAITRRNTVARNTAALGKVSVSVSGLRVHSAPSIGAGVIGFLGLGQRVGVMGRVGSWIKVQLPRGGFGWISSLFARGQGAQRIGSTGAANKSGTSRVSATRTTTQTTTVSRSRVGVNVRNGPSLSSAILSVLPAGGAYRIVNWSSGWAHVRLASGGTGWISGSVLGYAPHSSTPSSAVTARTSARASTAASGRSVVTAGVRLHSGPGLSRPVVRLVAAGTRVQILGFSSGWTLVRLPSRQTGYVLGIYVRQ